MTLMIKGEDNVNYGRYMGSVRDYVLKDDLSKLDQLQDRAKFMLANKKFGRKIVEEIPFAPSYLRTIFNIDGKKVVCIAPSNYCPESYVFYLVEEEEDTNG